MILIVSLHILVCCFLILVVLLQSGKAGDLASTFGGAGSQTAFGTRSATTLLTKLTAVSAALFMVTCLILAGLGHRGESSVMEDVSGGTASATETTQSEPEAAPAGEAPVAADEAEVASPPPETQEEGADSPIENN